MAKKTKKIFVLDTNVLLHDHTCIYNFEENDIVIPIVALEELDHFKKGNEMINFHAREFTRELDKIAGDNLFNGGIPLGKKHGKLRIETGKPFTQEMEQSFAEKSPDHRILAIAYHLNKENASQSVILVTKDINLRMKAKSLGIVAQDYLSDKVMNIDTLNREIEILQGVDDGLIQSMYESNDGVPAKKLKLKPYANQYYIIKGGKSSALGRYNETTQMIDRVEKTRAYGIEPRNSEQTFSLDALLRRDIQLVALTGKAGTGKTLLALAAALQQEKHFNQILLARPIVPLANRDLGFLPGDVNEKISPYMQPLFDNLTVIKNKFKSTSKDYQFIEEMQRTDRLVITPLAYIRGRSLSDVFFIVDEAQNLTPHEVKTIITRAGEGTKFVFTGDIQQIDHPYLDMKSNGLTYLSDKMHGQSIFAHVNLVKGERSYLADLASSLL
ncbi:MAG TPA: PhoH family protein [Tenuifilaceae bacterium]|nr:PhoH family protein [Tenuifilaceae bacterium]HPE18223.1 PhoH family protein [Tenuifilaceae bacterium]HPJ45506.1 PhoH family protein [Tenuifilaceae bacterium]HPQ33913.1 PhoH family protein [Tenuifilaceae bacterium]HRX68626.1 PhoH family protein [Tenuifilaceae bacterium]